MPNKIQQIQLDNDGGTRFVECVLRRSSRARRINLRVTSRDRAILALPNRLPWSEAFSFLANQREWLRKKTLEFPSVTRLEEHFRRGGKVCLDKNPRVLEWSRSDLCVRNSISIGQEEVFLTLGKEADLEVELMKTCFKLARQNLPVRLARLSNLQGLNWNRYRVANQRSRWGSCSNAGTISLNWRLILLPYELGNYVLFHELAHLKYMNHSVAFWDFLESLVPHSKELDLQLRQLSRTIMGLARDT
jgi:predicted metal-dependent hydrolase